MPSALPQLGWQLELHATLALLGFGVLGIAALAGLAYLIQERQLKRHALTSWFYSLPNVGPAGDACSSRCSSGASPFFRPARCSVFSSRISMAGRLGEDRVVGGGLDAFTPRWSLVLALGRLSHKKTALLSVAGYVFILLTFWGINSLSEAHVFPHEG